MPDWRQVTKQVAQGEGIDPELFAAQIEQESGFDPGARSPAGAVGIAQIVPGYHPDVDPTNPIASLRYAAKWMRQLIDQYGGDVRKALSHYNGGQGAVQALVSGKPYEETMQYLGAILGPKGAVASEIDDLVDRGPSPGGLSPRATESRDFQDRGPPQRVSVAGGEKMTGGYGNPEIDRVIAAKGEPLSIVPIDPYVNVETTDKTGKKTKSQEPNPTPKYRFRFKDGTSLDVQTSEGGGRDILGGTALTSLSKPPAVPTDVKTAHIKALTELSGASAARSLAQAQAAAARAQAAAAKAGQDRVTVGSKVYERGPDGQYQIVIDGSKGEKPTTSTHVIGGRIYTTDAEGNVLKATDARTPQAIEAEGLGLTKSRLEIQKLTEGMLPAQRVIIQKQAETLEYVRGLFAKGQITEEQASQYMNATRAAAEAALRGTTPFEEQKQLQDVQRAAASDASGLLRERMQSMTSLGSSLASSALSGASHAMFRPGQTTLGVDPLAIARQFSADAGGDKLLEVANALLARAGLPAGPPSGASGVSPAPTSAGLVAGALTPPVSPETSLSMPGALPAGLTARAA